MTGPQPSILDVQLLTKAAERLSLLQQRTPPTDDELVAKAGEIVTAAIRARDHELGVEMVQNQPGGNDGGFGGPRYQGPPTDIPEHATGAEWAWVPEKMRYFYERSFHEPTNAAEEIGTARTELGSGALGSLFSVQTATDRWAGRSHDEFVGNFLNPMLANGVSNQQGVITELAIAMHAYGAILRQARCDAYDIAVAAINSLDAIGEKSSSDFKTTLNVVGLALSVVTALATGGSGLGISLGILGATVSGIGTGIDVADQIGNSSTVAEIMDSLAAMFESLRAAMDNQERGIAATLDVSQEAAHRSVLSGDILGAALLPTEPQDLSPDISEGEMPTSDDFHPRT